VDALMHDYLSKLFNAWANLGKFSGEETSLIGKLFKFGSHRSNFLQ
jgi:hypothetical protein